MADDYIERQAALDALGVTKNATKYGGDHSGYDTRMLYEIHDVLTGLPSADVVQVRHGRWTHKPNVYGVAYCSECDYELRINNASYCPNCGAKMDEHGEG